MIRLQSLKGVTDFTQCAAARDRLVKTPLEGWPVSCKRTSFVPAHFKASMPPLLLRDFLFRTTTSCNTTTTMATQNAPSGVCATCSQPATTQCAGCAKTEHTGTPGATLYCSEACQIKGWSQHKAACQAAQGRKKLFRAAELLQETFLALKSEILDFNVTKVERAGDGKIHFFDAPFKLPAIYGPISKCLEEAPEKCAVMSYCAGGDVFADTFYSIVVKAFAGKLQLAHRFPKINLYTDI